MIFGFFKKKPQGVAEKGEQETKAKAREEVIGKVSHYFSHSKAAVLKLECPLSIGDNIHIKGPTTDFEQKVTSMQIMGKTITSGKQGDEIGLLVKDKVRTTDMVYKIV